MEILTKICTKCKTEKSITEFNKQKDKKDGFRSHCKICLSLSYNENKDKILEQRRKHYKLNHDEMISKQRKYRNQNKIKISENQKEYYKKNKHDILSKQKEYGLINKEKISIKTKNYYKNNKDKVLESNKKYIKSEKGKLSRINTEHKRRTKFKNGDVTTEQLKQLYTNSKVCYWCDNKLVKNDIHLDHYVPIAKGGLHTISNLVLSCSKCNLTKGSNDPLAFAIQIGKLF